MTTTPTPLDVLKDLVLRAEDQIGTVQDHLGGNYDDHDFEDEHSILDNTRHNLWAALALFIPGIPTDASGMHDLTLAAQQLVLRYDDGSPVRMILESGGMVFYYYPRHDEMSREDRQQWLDDLSVVHTAERLAYEAAHPSPEVEL